MLIFKRFLLRLEISPSLDVSVPVLAIEVTALSVFVHATFGSGPLMSTFCSTGPEILLLVAVSVLSPVLLALNQLSIFETIKMILLHQP